MIRRFNCSPLPSTTLDRVSPARTTLATSLQRLKGLHHPLRLRAHTQNVDVTDRFFNGAGCL
jgi:hypothetical protein